MIRHSQALDSYIASDGETVRMSYAKNGDLLIKSTDGKVILDVISKSELDAAYQRGIAMEAGDGAPTEFSGFAIGLVVGCSICFSVYVLASWVWG